MKKLGKLKWLWSLAAVLLLLGGMTACSSDDDDDDGSGPSGIKEDPKPADSTGSHLVKFNAANTEWTDSDLIIKGSASSGGKEGYLVLNKRIDLSADDVTIEADVAFSSLSGHVGLGFISVVGKERKSYSLLTGQNIKNVSCTLGGGGNGLTPAVSWATGTTYHFKAAFTSANYAADGSKNAIVYTVSDANGTELGTNTTPMWHSEDDIVYVALGGTTAENASYSNIKIKVGDTEYTFDGLDEQTELPSLSASTSALRLKLNNSDTFTYESTTSGKNSGITLEYDNTLLEVTDDKNGTVTVKGIKPTTSTSLKVINAGTTYITTTLTVVVEDFAAEDSYGALTSVYPANGAEAAYEDGELRITFDAEPTVSATGSVSIYDADGNWVDTIKATDEAIDVQSGNTIKVKDQMIRVEGKSVFITPHYGVLEAGKTYYVAIPKDVITGTLNGQTFVGLTENKDKASWMFTVRAAPTISSTITVDGAETSAADFRTIHGALLAIGSNTGNYTIKVAEGTYRELVHFNGAANITIEGPENNRGAGTVIQWTNLNKWNGSMDTRAVVYFGTNAGNLTLKNITITNTTDRSEVGTADTQAETLYYKGSNHVSAANCSFNSYQDTICTRGKAWFYDCYIEGDTDFIWGYSDVALFEKCDLVCLNDEAKSAKSDILFVARTGTLNAAKMGKGYVLLNSNVTVKDGITAYLGRNAGSGDFYDQIAIVNTAFAVEGQGVVSTDLWSDAKVYTYLNGKEDKIGLKFYNLTGDIDTTKAIEHVGKISAADYALEFNGRRAILNRAYIVEEDAYAAKESFDEATLSSLEAYFNADEDASKDNEYEGEDGPVKVTWDFKSMTTSLASGMEINGTKGVVADDTVGINLLIDATGGKFAQRSSGDAQVNNGTIIKVPVSVGSVVSFSGNWKTECTIDGIESDTLAYTGEPATKTGYVTIVARSNNCYFYSISVTGVNVTEWR